MAICENSTSSRDCRFEKLLSLTGEPGSKWLRRHTEIVISVVLLHLATRDAVRYFEQAEVWRLVMAVSLGVCFLCSASRRLRLASIYLALPLLSYKLIRGFPSNANHFFVEVLVVVFLALGYRPAERGDDPNEERLRALSQSFRWMLVIIFGWSGIRKLGQGTYFDGSFLASSIPKELPTRDFFEWFLPSEEFLRMANTAFPGPYQFDSALPVVMSNFVYIAEIAITVMLLTKRFRIVGFWLAFVAILAIELVARELMFGGLFVILLLCYTEGRVSSRLLPVFVAYYSLLLFMAAGVIPSFQFN